MSLLCVVAVSVLMIWTASSFAVPIAPGVTALAVGEPDPTGGVAIAGPLVSPFASLTFNGTLTSTVISGDPSNALGGLTFIYTLTNNIGSADAIGRLTINSFFDSANAVAFLTDMNYQTPPTGQIPSIFDRSVGGGNTVGFSFLGAPIFSGTLMPGSTTARLVVQTNAPLWQPTLASVINGSVTMTPSFAPVPVPEPSTMVLAVLALVGIAAVVSGPYAQVSSAAKHSPRR